MWLGSFPAGVELGASSAGKEGFLLALAPCGHGLTSGVAKRWILQGAPGGTREGIPGTLAIGNRFPQQGPSIASPRLGVVLAASLNFTTSSFSTMDSRIESQPLLAHGCGYVLIVRVKDHSGLSCLFSHGSLSTY